MPKKRISKEKSIRHAKLLTESVISLVIIGICVYFVKTGLDNKKVLEQSPYVDQTVTQAVDIETTTLPDPDQVIYESLSVNTKDKFRGDLILVNADHQYFGGDEELVSITDMNEETNRDFFSAVDSTYTILKPVYEPMAKLLDEFYKKYNNDKLIIYGSYRTTDFQQELYEQDLADTGEETSTRVAKPGFSEHETGLAFDLTESENHDYDGKGDYAWINANCYRYGFIIRYTEAKEKITKFRDEPWHFRYVGIPHAYYMDNHDLCLEEYIDLIREHPYDKKHLEFTDDNNNDYEVFFVASDDGAEKTTVPVPAGLKYDISGNNVDGFIVTVYKNKKNTASEITTTSAAETTVTTTETTAGSENDTEETEE